MLISYPIRNPLRVASTPPQAQAQTLYGKGPADALFVLFCALAFTVTRELVMRYVLGSFARWYLARNHAKDAPGWKSKKERRRREHIVVRFAEQGWSFLYCTCSWSLGTVR
jgi:acyl-CoA-dependent ceramide synthase